LVRRTGFNNGQGIFHVALIANEVAEYAGAELEFKVREDEINNTYNINFNFSKNEVYN